MSICEHCGLPIQWLPDMSLFGDREWCPGHPELLQPKHDGKLDEQGKATARLLLPSSEVHITEYVRGVGQHVSLTPSQALSLLVWLKQEEATLQTLAKEQEV